MELLLILSAMLSALTGALVGVRQPDTGQQVSAVVSGIEARQVCAAVTKRQAQVPAVSLPPVLAVLAGSSLPRLVVLGIPSFLDRPRT